MGVLQHRKRIADRVPQGGGLTAESLTDTATDGDWEEHETGDGPSGMLADQEIDYDENYGPFGVSTDEPTPEPYTVEEARHDASSFAAKPFDRADLSRDVAQQWNPGVVSIAPNADAYLLAGADPLRKSITITNATTNGTDGTAFAHLGPDAGVPRVPGPGAYLLRQSYLQAVTGESRQGDSVTFTHTGEIYAVAADYGVAQVPVRLVYVIERYYR